MTEPDMLALHLAVDLSPPCALIQLEVWGDAEAAGRRIAEVFGIAPPAPCRALASGERRLLWLEPQVWLARAPLSDRARILSELADALGDEGAATDVSGGLACLRITGPLWRELLIIGAVFDAESPAFAPGCVAGTVIHHLPVRLDVIDPLTVDAYTPPSYAHDLLAHWSQSAQRLREG